MVQRNHKKHTASVEIILIEFMFNKEQLQHIVYCYIPYLLIKKNRITQTKMEKGGKPMTQSQTCRKGGTLKTSDKQVKKDVDRRNLNFMW